jgi:hypothetical protein
MKGIQCRLAPHKWIEVCFPGRTKHGFARGATYMSHGHKRMDAPGSSVARTAKLNGEPRLAPTQDCIASQVLSAASGDGFTAARKANDNPYLCVFARRRRASKIHINKDLSHADSSNLTPSFHSESVSDGGAVFSELDRSNSWNRGCSNSAMNIVGTPYSVVQRSFETHCKTISGPNDPPGSTMHAP